MSSAAIPLPDIEATQALARRAAGLARPGDLLALWGDLGAGKTAFARAFVNALPGADEPVPSPTFTLVQTYERGALPVWHVDLYRLEEPEEALELGLEDALADAVVLLEWPQRLGPLLPGRRVDLHFEQAGQGRQVTLEPHGLPPERAAAWRALHAA